MEKQIVYIVRDVEERYIQGVYGTIEAAQDEITEKVKEVIATQYGMPRPDACDADQDSDEWEWVRDSYEILEMPLEWRG